MTRITSLLLAVCLFSLSVPSFACGPHASSGAHRNEVDPLAGAVAVTGLAGFIGERGSSAPLLELYEPIRPGQTTGFQYVAIVPLKRDASFRSLRARIAKGQSPRVLLERKSGKGAWRVAAFLPRG